MIDLHSHILPGIDDGARTLEEARDLARRSAADGVRAIAATPHVRADYPTGATQMEQGVAALRADFAAELIPVEVLTGGEVDLQALADLPPDDLRRFTLAGGSYLLLEFPYRGWPLGLDTAVHTLCADGLTPLLAHPERNPEVQDRPDRIEALVEAGARVQVTAASVDGRLDQASRSTAFQLFELGLVHVLASDAHGRRIREAGLAGAVRAIGDRALSDYLTNEAPAAIVAGEPLAARTPRLSPGTASS